MMSVASSDLVTPVGTSLKLNKIFSKKTELTSPDRSGSVSRASTRLKIDSQQVSSSGGFSEKKPSLKSQFSSILKDQVLRQKTELVEQDLFYRGISERKLKDKYNLSLSLGQQALLQRFQHFMK